MCTCVSNNGCKPLGEERGGSGEREGVKTFFGVKGRGRGGIKAFGRVKKVSGVLIKTLGGEEEGEGRGGEGGEGRGGRGGDGGGGLKKSCGGARRDFGVANEAQLQKSKAPRVGEKDWERRERERGAKTSPNWEEGQKDLERGQKNYGEQ